MLEKSRFVRLNPDLDAAAFAARFAASKRVQIRDVLERESAERIVRLLIEQTPWGLSWQADNDGPHRIRQEEIAGYMQANGAAVSAKLQAAMSTGHFAFIYSQYRMSKAIVEGWSKSPEHDRVVHELNDESFLDFIREVTGLPEIVGCDAQATHFGPNQFLSWHQDIDVEENEKRLVAYVLSLNPDGWRPDWGGYLNFFGPDGDIVESYMPRFNCLNMFRVPADHNVSLVAPFAAGNRLAITGWFRGR